MHIFTYVYRSAVAALRCAPPPAADPPPRPRSPPPRRLLWFETPHPSLRAKFRCTRNLIFETRDPKPQAPNSKFICDRNPRSEPQDSRPATEAPSTSKTPWVRNLKPLESPNTNQDPHPSSLTPDPFNPTLKPCKCGTSTYHICIHIHIYAYN